MSVTYGAGGSTKGHTIKLANEIQEKYGVPTIAHLTCVCANKDSIRTALSEMKNAGIENILALRGDIPKNYDGQVFTDFAHASELVKLIKESGDFCVGGACYPEVHPDSANKQDDIANLKKKVEAGCEYLTTQMFFDNNIFFNFMYRIREAGITVPVIPGIMPITKRVQVKNAVKLSGCNVPERFKNIVDRFGDTEAAMKQAGIAYATDQIIDLMDKVKRVVLDAVKTVPGYLADEAVDFFIDEFADSSIMICVRFYAKIDRYWDSVWAARWNIKKAFDENGIVIPYNKLDVNLDSCKKTDNRV